MNPTPPLDDVVHQLFPNIDLKHQARDKRFAKVVARHSCNVRLLFLIENPTFAEPGFAALGPLRHRLVTGSASRSRGRPSRKCAFPHFVIRNFLLLQFQNVAARAQKRMLFSALIGSL